MDGIINISALKKKMKDKPRGQRLYDFLYGSDEPLLSKKQMKEIRDIAEKEHKKFIQFIDEAIQGSK